MRDDPFFKNTPRMTVDMAGQQIEFPILYYDLRYITWIFTVKTNKLRNILPHSNFRLIEIWPGTGMLGITAFEYRDTSIGPYNEIVIATPIIFPPQFVLPGITAISMIRNNFFPVYIRHLLVTTDIAFQVGAHFWNYPKLMAEIIFEDKDEGVEVTLKEKGSLILKMFSKRLPANESTEVQFHSYSIKDNIVMHGSAIGWAQRLGTTMIGEIAQLKLGDHQISEELRELNLKETAYIGQYADGVMIKLYDLDQQWNVDTRN